MGRFCKAMDMNKLEQLNVEQVSSMNLEMLDNIFVIVSEEISLDINLETIFEHEHYRKLPNLLLEAVKVYEKRNRVPNLAFFKISKCFYTKNPEESSLQSRSNEWIMALLERLESQFGSEEVLTFALSAGFNFYNKKIENSLAKTMAGNKQIKWYSASTDEIIRILQYLKCSKSSTSSTYSTDLKQLIADLRRISNLFSSPKRESIETLLNSFPAEHFEEDESIKSILQR